MIVDRIDYPEDEKERALFEELCDFIETLDFDLVVAAGSEFGVLCLRLREAGKEATSLVTMPLDRPNAVALANSIASSRSRTDMIGASGPNDS